MKYLKLTELYEQLDSTTKRLEKTKILSDFLKEIKVEEKDILYLLLGRIYPEYDERVLGISSQLAAKAISKSTGANSTEVVKEWKSIGDIGQVAEKLSKKKRQTTLDKKELSIKKVIENLRAIPELVGKGTVDKKLALITELLTSASPLESKYLIRTLIGDLRIGTQESTIRDAIASAFFEKEKEQDAKETSDTIQEALDKSNDIAEVFEIAKKQDLKLLRKIPLEIGKPVKLMLAQKALDIPDGFRALGKPCALEYKYDGFRMLIHKKGDKVFLYTRRLENVTSQFPEIIEYVKKYTKGESLMIDAEAVGYNKKTKQYRPFQEISQRIKRKYDIEKVQEELPVELNVFDVIYYNGKSLIEEPFRKRRELVKSIIDEKPYKIVCAKQIITDSEKKAEEFYKKALADNQEGIMMKNLEAPYQSGRRVGHMLKLKPNQRELDLVITGAEYGTGKRSGWMSSFIVSCQDGDEFLEIGKVGTGIKEKSEEGLSFEELTAKLTPLIKKEKGRTVEIKPRIVVSITYQEIQKSPTYNSGFALRFPRVTVLRPDRDTGDIATLQEIQEDYDIQQKKKVY